MIRDSALDTELAEPASRFSFDPSGEELAEISGPIPVEIVSRMLN